MKDKYLSLLGMIAVHCIILSLCGLVIFRISYLNDFPTLPAKLFGYAFVAFALLMLVKMDYDIYIRGG